MQTLVPVVDSLPKLDVRLDHPPTSAPSPRGGSPGQGGPATRGISPGGCYQGWHDAAHGGGLQGPDPALAPLLRQLRCSPLLQFWELGLRVEAAAAKAGTSQHAGAACKVCTSCTRACIAAAEMLSAALSLRLHVPGVLAAAAKAGTMQHTAALVPALCQVRRVGLCC